VAVRIVFCVPVLVISVGVDRDLIMTLEAFDTENTTDPVNDQGECHHDDDRDDNGRAHEIRHERFPGKSEEHDAQGEDGHQYSPGHPDPFEAVAMMMADNPDKDKEGGEGQCE
jgi:hypothetical protein